MADISPFGSVASASKSGSSSSESSSSWHRRSASSQSESSPIQNQQSTSDEDSADEYYAHISRRGVTVSPVSQEKPKPNAKPKILAPGNRPKQKTNEEAKHQSVPPNSVSDINMIKIGIEIDTSLPEEETRPQKKEKPKE